MIETGVTVEQELDLLRAMLEIRCFEDECHRMFAQGLVRGSTHLGQGQEGVAVGACRALRAGDTMTCTYRGHAAVLAMGAPLDAAFGEILGKAEGLCRGKGGSMHLTDVSRGVLGSFAIVGAHLPIATGVAFAARYRGTDEVTLCFFGDGATNIGAFHEALNLAAVWRLPVLFVCENNRYMEYTPIASVTSVPNPAADRAAANGMPGVIVDGNDVIAVHGVMAEAVERARSGGGPTVVEALTYRHYGHSRTDPGTYRPEAEVEEWLARDPLVVGRQRLFELGVTQTEVDVVDARAAETVAAASRAAQDAPAADPAEAFTDVWADGGWAWRT
jgi:acetoin:2,6-dichlorophenolindophenol oxidoreductase subunit alpha